MYIALIQPAMMPPPPYKKKKKKEKTPDRRLALIQQNKLKWRSCVVGCTYLRILSLVYIFFKKINKWKVLERSNNAQ